MSVYPDRAGVRWWTKAWFNNREEGEASVEIEREQAIRFIHDNIEKDAWLEEFFPKQMEVYHNAIEQTKEQLLKQINMIEDTYGRNYKTKQTIRGTGTSFG